MSRLKPRALSRRLTLTCALSTIAVAAAAGPAAARDDTVTSFDGTTIAVHFFPAAELPAGRQAPTIIQGPGFGSAGDTDPESTDVTGLGVGPLRHAGYNVVTFDPRGIGGSGGQAELDSPAIEGRDTSAIIDWIARQPEAQLDAANDPRLGMTGGSYGGGIQLATASRDHRIDAIVPLIAWHSLTSSLDKANIIKTSWVKLLVLLSAINGNRFDPGIPAGEQSASTGTTFNEQTLALLRSAGPGDAVAKITAPTLLIQGTVDNLFTLDEAIQNYRLLRNAHVPTGMIWYCGGHGACLTKAGKTVSQIPAYTLAWLKRYVRKDRSVSTGPGFRWVDQRGGYHFAKQYPPAPGKALAAVGSGRLKLQSAGASGPYTGKLPSDVSALAAPLLRPTIPTEAKSAINVRLRARKTTDVLGAPRLVLTYRGSSSTPKNHVLAQLVDETTGKVFGNQITPITVTLDGKTHTAAVPMEVIAATLKKHEAIKLQIVADSTAYNTFPDDEAKSTIRFTRIRITVPTLR